MPKIFISYARDQSYGENLAAETQQRLQEAGFEVLRNVFGLKLRYVWYGRLKFELKTSDAVVLILSKKVVSAKWVHNEISMARELNLPVIPVFAEKFRPPSWLGRLKALDFRVQCNWPALIAALPAVTGSAGSTAALKLTATPSKPAWASASGKDQYGTYADLEFKGIVQRFRHIEAGTFSMGSPKDEEGRSDDETLHQVTLSQAFWMADTACTQAFWQAVMGNNPSHFKGDQNPVEQVSWEDAQRFIQKLKQQVSGLSLRLPTEAEWEYACRAGTTSAFRFGGKHDLDTTKVNYSVKWDEFGASCKTVPVKSYSPNPWGLYEMHGNVWEWCEGGYAEYPQQAVTDPRGAPASSRRVVRGGSWGTSRPVPPLFIPLLRSALHRYFDIGIRLALG